MGLSRRRTGVKADSACSTHREDSPSTYYYLAPLMGQLNCSFVKLNFSSTRLW